MLRTIALYAGAALAANVALAGPLEGHLTGELAAIRETVPPAPLPDAALIEDGAEIAPDFAGRPTVLNFWATWCAPCREEMPELEALSAAMPQIEVALVAMDRSPEPRILGFLEEVGVKTARDLRDPSGEFSRAAGVMGLPTTLVLDAEGREVARLVGIVDWSSQEAMAMMASLVPD